MFDISQKKKQFQNGINTPNAAVCFTLTAHYLNDNLGYWI